MSKGLRIVIVCIGIILVVGGITLLLHEQDNTSSSNTSRTSDQENNNSKPVATSSVAIEGFAFSPAAITIKKGTTVTWTNDDNITHTVTETDGKSGPDSGSLTHGKSYSFTYTTPGTFTYHCAIHPDMTGTVTVTD